jgi:hypothetical protein
MSERFQIWSSGGGTQSSAIAVLILEGILPRPDFAFIADTGRETGETWEYLDNVVNPALSRIGLTVERLKPPAVPDYFNGKGTLLIPAFFTGEFEAKGGNFCSGKWKTEFVKRVALERGLVPAVNWLGISTDEMRRLRTPKALNWLLRFPLIFDAPRSRNDCVNLIAEYGWPPAPKSSCWMCPNRRDPQWIHLRETRPDEFARAVAFDLEMRQRKPDAFLHESRTPLGEVVFQEKPGDDQHGQLTLCDSGECFV